MPFNPDLAVEQLVGMYRDAYIRLLEKITEKQVRGTETAFQRALLRDVDKILKDLDESTEEWAKQVVPKRYRGIQEDVLQTYKRAGIEPPAAAAEFGRVHRRSMEVLAENLVDNLHEATAFVGRRIRDQWRRTTLEVIGDRRPTGETLREARDAFAQRMSEQGFESFRDRAGRQWRLDAYADMAVRASDREVANTALINQNREFGNDLVQFSEHTNPCEICAPLEGRVYSISGESEDYPALDVAFSEGYANIHPNCKHVLAPYVPALDDDPEATKQKSNRSFERDPRTQAEKERYEREQKEKARERQDRKQWERYRAHMPDETPESFSVFRRMKQADSDRFRELQSDYRTVRQEIAADAT